LTDTRCQARQESDQMRCAACGLLWDTNDPEPPVCGQQVPTQPAKPRALAFFNEVQPRRFVSGLPD
jgi:hypothetical protein